MASKKAPQDLRDKHWAPRTSFKPTISSDEGPIDVIMEEDNQCLYHMSLAWELKYNLRMKKSIEILRGKIKYYEKTLEEAKSTLEGLKKMAVTAANAKPVIDGLTKVVKMLESEVKMAKDEIEAARNEKKVVFEDIHHRARKRYPAAAQRLLARGAGLYPDRGDPQGVARLLSGLRIGSDQDDDGHEKRESEKDRVIAEKDFEIAKLKEQLEEAKGKAKGSDEATGEDWVVLG